MTPAQQATWGTWTVAPGGRNFVLMLRIALPDCADFGKRANAEAGPGDAVGAASDVFTMQKGCFAQD